MPEPGRRLLLGALLLHFKSLRPPDPRPVVEVRKEYILLNERALSLGEGPERERIGALLSQGLKPLLAGLRDLARTEGKDAPSLLCIMREAALMVRKLKQDKEDPDADRQ